MENYSSLLFELASVDRLDIMFLLKKTPLKLSHISNKLNFTVQETSRNMARLSEAELITKDVDGAFHLTPYGEEALNLLSGFRFLFDNRKYFAAHTLRELPQEFRDSLGMLEGSEFIGDVMVGFHNIERLIANAGEHVWILTNQILASTIPYLMQAVERGTEFRLLMPKDYLPSKDIREIVLNPAFEKAARTRRLQIRYLDKIDAFLCLSEKEASAIGFPNPEGKLDYIGFNSKNTTATQWTKALFTHFWDKATTQTPDQLTNPPK